MIIAINKHSRQWAHFGRDTYDSQHLHICLVLAKTSVTCLYDKTLWDQIHPQRKAQQTVVTCSFPVKSYSLKGVHDCAKRKSNFFSKTTNCECGRLLANYFSFRVNHAGGICCYWLHFRTLLFMSTSEWNCPAFQTNLRMFRLSFSRFFLESFFFFFFQMPLILEFYYSRQWKITSE